MFPKLPAHSAHLWKIGGVLFALGTGIKYITYELVSTDIKKRGEKDTKNCRWVPASRQVSLLRNLFLGYKRGRWYFCA